jgi:LPXTG-motif cell wall-anchored protein
VRLKSIAAVVMAGLAGAVALSGPASAAPTSPSPGATLTGVPRCSNGEWQVNWTLTTTGTGGADGILSKVTFTYDPPPVPPGVTYVPTLGPFSENATIAGDGEFTVLQSLGRYHPTAVLAFTLTWHQGATVYTKSLRTEVAEPKGCPTPTPIAMPPGTRLPKPTETAPGGTPETPAGPMPTVTTAWTPPGKPVPTPTPTTPAAAAPAPSASTEAAVLTAADSGGLPRTGAAVASIAGIAAVLIGAGLSLFFASRRRRARFTA